jgi:hypothetical protein
MDKSEISRLQTYLQTKLGARNLTLAPRKEDKNSLEVHIGGEFVGTVYRDEDEGDVSYDFNMAILDMDLPPAA